MRFTLTASLIITIVLIGVVLLVGEGSNWPTVENPPYQGEALDKIAFSGGKLTHSEQALDRAIREPQNTWSNLAFVIAGAWLIGNATLRSSRLAGAMLIAVGVGSFLYHASASRTLRQLDVAAMYGLFLVLSALALAVLSPKLKSWMESHIASLTVTAVAFAIVCTLFRNFRILDFKPLSLTTITAVTATLTIGVLLIALMKNLTPKRVALTGAAILLFVIGAVCQTGDRPHGWLINPSAIVQPHALWHVCAAIATTLAVRLLEYTSFDKVNALHHSSRVNDLAG